MCTLPGRWATHTDLLIVSIMPSMEFIVCIKILSPVSHNSCKNKTLRSRWGGWISRNAAQARYSADARPQMASLWKLIFGQHVTVAPLALPPIRPRDSRPPSKANIEHRRDLQWGAVFSVWLTQYFFPVLNLFIHLSVLFLSLWRIHPFTGRIFCFGADLLLLKILRCCIIWILMRIY